MIRKLIKGANFGRAEELLKKYRNENYMDTLDFSSFIHALLIPEYGYVIDTGSICNANIVVAEELIKRVKRHPILWKFFFMVA